MPAGRTDGGGLWQYGFQVMLHTADHVNAWEAIAAYLAEGAMPIVVPMWNTAFFPAPLDDRGRRIETYGSIPHSDDSFFSDGTGYDQEVVVASVVGAAALRATTLTIRITYGGELRGWHPFTIEHPTKGPRMYGITSVGEPSGTDYTVRIEPPLREAVTGGEVVNFDRPRCVMQLNGTMPLTLDVVRMGQPSVSFIESFLPEPD